jgi:hypothetical protein
MRRVRRLPEVGRLAGHPRREFTPAWLRPWPQRFPLAVGLAIASAAAVTIAVTLLPRYVLSWDLAGASPPADRAAAINGIRTSLLQGLAGLGLLTGAVFTWRQLQLTRQGQAAERFTAAVAHMGDGNADVRLGGVYALELIARTSPNDRDAVVDLLCAFIRRHASVSAETRQAWLNARTSSQAPPSELAGTLPAYEPFSVQAPDVHAAVRVLARRRPRAGEVLHLDRLAIPAAQLEFARLARADLHYSDLRSVDFIGADLHEADLTGANLTHANLRHADFGGADMRNMVCVQAILNGADLRRADLSGADLTGSNLSHARLDHTDLRGACLTDANLTEARLHQAFCDADTEWPVDYDWHAAGARVDRDAPPVRSTDWLQQPPKATP